MSIRVEGIHVGQVLAGKYRVEKILGAGGMGVVLAVQHLRLDQRLAIKLMLPEMLASEEASTRFLREARSATMIKSEHVVRVFDVDSLENGAPYIVMELLDGRDLADILRDSGAFSIEDAVDLLLQVCEVVAEAHALGIVHRDLKPSNLFASRGGDGQLFVRVLDFGISKLTRPDEGGAAMDMTKTASAMGSPLYMSPEQMQSARDVDGRTDIWALGVILHELVAGRVPFNGATPIEVALKIAAHPAPALRTARPDTPPGLEAVVLKCLDKEPARRFASVAELAAALARWAPVRSRPSLDRIAKSQRRGTAPNAVRAPVSSHPPPLDGTMTAHPSTVVATKSIVPEKKSEASAGTTAPPAWGTTLLPNKRARATAVTAIVSTGIAAGIAVFIAARPASRPAASSADGDVVAMPNANAATTVNAMPTTTANTNARAAAFEGASPAAAIGATSSASVEAQPRMETPAAKLRDDRPVVPASDEPTAPKHNVVRSRKAVVGTNQLPAAASSPSSSAIASSASASAVPPKPGVWQERK
jgi:serine/threonine-protein kinase